MRRTAPQRWSVIVLLVVHAGLLAWGAYHHSPTSAEPAQLVAGISCWQFGRFELYRVNPPLTRMVAALPALAAGCETDWSWFYEAPRARPAFSIGEDFVAANGKRSLWLFILARWACIPFSLIGGLVCYLWGRELYGPVAGLLVLGLWCFEPNVIAHGQLITPDMAATAFGLLAAYLFWRWLRKPCWSRALAAGVGLGLAQLAKMSWVILFGLWPVLWLVWLCLPGDDRASLRAGARQAAQLAAIVFVALWLLNLGYGFDGTFTKLADYTFVSETLAGQETAGLGGNRFQDSWLGPLPVPLPKQYLVGMDMQKRDFEDYAHPSYLRGQWKDGGWWYYYLYGLAVKVPHGLQILLAVAAGLLLLHRCGSAQWRDEIVLLVPPISLLVLVSSQTEFNHHFRYVLPAMGLLLVFAGRAASAAAGPWSRIRAAIVVCAFVFAAASSLSCYPHTLSYFNELAGGPENGPCHLLHSSIDWGQDLIYLKLWLNKQGEDRPLYLAFEGGFDPADVGIEHEKPPRGGQTADGGVDFPPLEPGRYAVSVSFLYGAPWIGHAPKNAFAYFRRLRPVARAGYSIYVYSVRSTTTPGKAGQ